MERNVKPEADSQYGSAVIEQLSRRASVRSYQHREIPDAMLSSILNAARQAPTSSNLQAYSLVVVRDENKRRTLAEIAGDQRHIVDAPVLVAICADLYRTDLICETADGTPASDTCEMSLIAVVDATLVGMCASMAADSLGLGTVMIGGLRNDPVAAAALLGLPPHVFVVFGLCIGWPSDVPPAKPRLPGELIIHQERYGDDLPEAAISGYNQELAAHHQSIGRDDSVPWSQRVADLCAAPHRQNLQDALCQLGFRFR